jgi:hypothetical protein
VFIFFVGHFLVVKALPLLRLAVVMLDGGLSLKAQAAVWDALKATGLGSASNRQWSDVEWPFLSCPAPFGFSLLCQEAADLKESLAIYDGIVGRFLSLAGQAGAEDVRPWLFSKTALNHHQLAVGLADDGKEEDQPEDDPSPALGLAASDLTSTAKKGSLRNHIEVAKANQVLPSDYQMPAGDTFPKAARKLQSAGPACVANALIMLNKSNSLTPGTTQIAPATKAIKKNADIGKNVIPHRAGPGALLVCTRSKDKVKVRVTPAQELLAFKVWQTGLFNVSMLSKQAVSLGISQLPFFPAVAALFHAISIGSSPR